VALRIAVNAGKMGTPVAVRVLHVGLGACVRPPSPVLRFYQPVGLVHHREHCFLHVVDDEGRIQGSVAAEAEPPVRVLELGRRHPEVEQEPVDAPDAEP